MGDPRRAYAGLSFSDILACVPVSLDLHSPLCPAKKAVINRIFSRCSLALITLLSRQGYNLIGVVELLPLGAIFFFYICFIL